MILKRGMDDAIYRAEQYIEAGADGIMIHSKSESAEEILEFLHKFREPDQTTPLVVVPSTYSSIKEESLHEAGANIVIYANQLLRATYPALLKTAKSILMNERS